MRFAAVIAVCAVAVSAAAQENYEIQVYGSDTVAPGRTMIELHSNFTVDGRKQIEDRLSPTNHAWHETVEVTRGLTPWSEVGFYVFTSIDANQEWQWVGSHVRPRVRAPESWHWPVGASLSVEFGYQRRAFSVDTWSIELRPIIDKDLGRWYASFNPTLESSSRGVEFSPNVAITFDATRKINIGAEYYGVFGPIGRFDPASEQQHQLYVVTNLDAGPDWEVNLGYGFALTDAGDRRLVKLILGRRFTLR